MTRHHQREWFVLGHSAFFNLPLIDVAGCTMTWTTAWLVLAPAHHWLVGTTIVGIVEACSFPPAARTPYHLCSCKYKHGVTQAGGCCAVLCVGSAHVHFVDISDHTNQANDGTTQSRMPPVSWRPSRRVSSTCHITVQRECVRGGVACHVSQHQRPLLWLCLHNDCSELVVHCGSSDTWWGRVWPSGKQHGHR